MKTACFLSLIFPLCTAGAFAGDPMPKKWQTDGILDSAQEWLASDLQDAPQQSINRITGAMAEIADAKLMIVYLRLYALLPPAEQARLFGEQQHWLKLRDAGANDASKPEEGGTAASMEANTAYEKFTEKRRIELEKRLATALKANNQASVAK